MKPYELLTHVLNKIEDKINEELDIDDCESAQTAIISLNKITGISEGEIKRFLVSFDMDKYYATHRNYFHSGDELLKDTFLRFYNCPIVIDETCWFHLSRIDSLDKFKEGILPLNISIKHI